MNMQETVDPRQNRRHSSLRWQALSESAVLVAIAAACVLVLLLLAGAPVRYLVLTWIAFVADLVVLRVAVLHLRRSVEDLPPPLKPWRREDAAIAVYEV